MGEGLPLVKERLLVEAQKAKILALAVVLVCTTRAETYLSFAAYRLSVVKDLLLSIGLNYNEVNLDQLE